MLATPSSISAATVHLAGNGHRPPVSVSTNTFLYVPAPTRCSQGLMRHQLLSRDHDQHPDLRKTRLCPSVTSATKCPYTAEECRFAHSQSELRVSFDRFYKVQPCAFYDRGKCRNGDLCRFAHGNRELRPGGLVNGESSRRALGVMASYSSLSRGMVRPEGGKTPSEYVPSPSPKPEEPELSASPPSRGSGWSSLASCSPKACASGGVLPQDGSPAEKNNLRDDWSPSTCPGDEDIVSEEFLSSSHESLLGILEENKATQAQSTVWSATSPGSESTHEGNSDDRRYSGDSTSISSDDKSPTVRAEHPESLVRQCSSINSRELRHALDHSLTHGYED